MRVRSLVWKGMPFIWAGVWLTVVHMVLISPIWASLWWFKVLIVGIPAPAYIIPTGPVGSELKCTPWALNSRQTALWSKPGGINSIAAVGSCPAQSLTQFKIQSSKPCCHPLFMTNNSTYNKLRYELIWSRVVRRCWLLLIKKWDAAWYEKNPKKPKASTCCMRREIFKLTDWHDYRDAEFALNTSCLQLLQRTKWLSRRWKHMEVFMIVMTAKSWVASFFKVMLV